MLINYGPDAGKLATVIDVVDGQRILIDGPQEATGVHRQVIGTRRVTLTPVLASGLHHNASQKSLKKAWTVSAPQPCTSVAFLTSPPLPHRSKV